MNSSPTVTTPTGADRNNSNRCRKLPTWLLRIDQTERATFVIDAWLTLDPRSQDTCLARLIAATIHDGPGTALERFAARGQLDAEAALNELNDATVPQEREPWLDALGRYILTRGNRS